MAYRDIKFGGDFEAWLDNKLSKIRTDAADKLDRVRGIVGLEGSKLTGSGYDSDNYGIYLNCTDRLYLLLEPAQHNMLILLLLLSVN